MADRWIVVRDAAAGWLAHHWKSLAHWAVVLAAMGYLVWQLPELRRSAVEAGTPLEHLDWVWVAAAVGLGVGALMLYGELHRRLLVIGAASVPVSTVQAITFAENAISNTVPVVGGAGSIAYAITRLRRRGVDAALASWSVFLPGVMSMLTLVVLGMIVTAVGGSLPVAVAVPLIALTVTVAVAFWEVLTHRAVLRRLLVLLVHVGRRLPWLCHHCRRVWTVDPDGISARLATRIGLLRPTPGQWVALIVVSVLTWTLDFLALHASAAAVGVPASWTVLALGFLAVQASIALQVLPGGAGLAEAGLLGVLVASGVAVAPAAATVLIYRAISWLGLSLIGWVVYAAEIHLAPPHRHRHAPETAPHAS
ncbi:lysylphosphatidylglycerol synthase transmembrane domain-containing protein [Pseudonocardia asaccharolytica]|uniref:TIGR00374 family protein n=1 Tax=Pseudonocardia asaccharolytica DSM 44247 = NBRC 16224 TaxID=1123024 RepID=A0A511CVI4_9PSEU|nr:lysylphosphatidylglycerol synthase transmembrane domain-containing protein [Pseudonocardia asaccharolytica]GEL16592.1 hypothetical protein PA7_04290 [Pseudonocardia asaccharolytica DSM 44247 = NBRC 16224]